MALGLNMGWFGREASESGPIVLTSSFVGHDPNAVIGSHRPLCLPGVDFACALSRRSAKRPLMNLHSLIDLIGPTPSRCSLNPIILDDVDCGSYVRQTVEYAVEESERVRSFILLPKNATGLAPAILAHHQHAGQFDLGKSEVVGLAGDPDQAYGAELAERGFVVIAPDAIAFEERNWSKIPGQAEYYELASRLVRGQTLLGKVLHDVRVALDYLTTRHEVDKSRIGFLGHSYGGRMAIWATAVDERIKAAVSNCGCVNYRNSLTRDAGIQMAFCLPGVLNLGDVEDVLCLAAPRAVLIQAATDDKWSRGARDMFDCVRSVFPNGQLEIRLWPGGHKFSKEMRETAYAFLSRHLSEVKVI
jgi:dienelactone hydrolase